MPQQSAVTVLAPVPPERRDQAAEALADLDGSVDAHLRAPADVSGAGLAAVSSCPGIRALHYIACGPGAYGRDS